MVDTDLVNNLTVFNIITLDLQTNRELLTDCCHCVFHDFTQILIIYRGEKKTFGWLLRMEAAFGCLYSPAS